MLDEMGTLPRVHIRHRRAAGATKRILRAVADGLDREAVLGRVERENPAILAMPYWRSTFAEKDLNRLAVAIGAARADSMEGVERRAVREKCRGVVIGLVAAAPHGGGILGDDGRARVAGRCWRRCSCASASARWRARSGVLLAQGVPHGYSCDEQDHRDQSEIEGAHAGHCRAGGFNAATPLPWDMSENGMRPSNPALLDRVS